jgi:hypothetical protein
MLTKTLRYDMILSTLGDKGMIRNVKNNLRELWNTKEVDDHKVLPVSRVASIIGIKDDTIRAWLDCKIIRLDVRVMTALAKYFDISQVVFDIQTNELIFRKRNKTNE